MVGRGGAFVVAGGASSACGCLYCLVFLVHSSALGSCLLPNVTRQFFSIHTVHLFTRKTLIRRRSTRRPPQRPSLLAISSQVSHSFMRYTISRGSAHSSLSLDVGVAATPIPHSNPISLYTTICLYLYTIVHH